MDNDYLPQITITVIPHVIIKMLILSTEHRKKEKYGNIYFKCGNPIDKNILSEYENGAIKYKKILHPLELKEASVYN